MLLIEERGRGSTWLVTNGDRGGGGVVVQKWLFLWVKLFSKKDLVTRHCARKIVVYAYRKIRLPMECFIFLLYFFHLQGKGKGKQMQQKDIRKFTNAVEQRSSSRSYFTRAKRSTLLFFEIRLWMFICSDEKLKWTATHQIPASSFIDEYSIYFW